MISSVLSNIPETVINYIAENVNESVRELEGIINSLLAQSIIFKRDVDLDLAERIVRKAVRCCESKPVTVEDIIQKVCSHYEIEESAIHTKTRKREVVQVRQVAMYLAKKHTDSSSSKIGELDVGIWLIIKACHSKKMAQSRSSN